MKRDFELYNTSNNITYNEFLITCEQHGVSRKYRKEIENVEKLPSKKKCGLYFQNKKVVDISQNSKNVNKFDIGLTIELIDPVKKYCKKPRVDWTDRHFKPFSQVQPCERLNKGNKRKQKNESKEKNKNEKKLPTSTKLKIRYSINIPPQRTYFPSTKKLSRFRRIKQCMEYNQEDIRKDLEKDIREELAEGIDYGDQFVYFRYYWQLFRHSFRPLKIKKETPHEFISTDNLNFPLILDWYVGDKSVGLKEGSEDVVNKKAENVFVFRHWYQDSGMDESIKRKILEGFIQKH